MRTEIDEAERKAIQADAGEAVEHPYVARVMAEFAMNMGFRLDGLPEYGMKKVAAYAAIVGACIARGVDPKVLESTPESGLAEAIALVEALAGKPVFVVVGDEVVG